MYMQIVNGLVMKKKNMAYGDPPIVPQPSPNV